MKHMFVQKAEIYGACDLCAGLTIGSFFFRCGNEPVHSHLTELNLAVLNKCQSQIRFTVLCFPDSEPLYKPKVDPQRKSM